MSAQKLTFGSLFAGIGGLDLGLERAGMHCLWQVEIDDYCQRVLAKHWPNVKRYKDVRDVGRHNLESVDLICGGFPCQPFSTAGNRKGQADDRNLWPEFIRIVEEIRPTWILGENVPGIISLYLDTVLSDLERHNYACWAFNIPACALDAPHRRERIYIVAHEKGTARPINLITQGTNGRTQQQSGGVHWNNGEPTGRGWDMEPQPRVVRVADGIPNRVDRLRTLGNAVVPQVAEWIGRQIITTYKGDNNGISKGL